MTVQVPTVSIWPPPNQSAHRSSSTPSTRNSYRAGHLGALMIVRSVAGRPARARPSAASCDQTLAISAELTVLRRADVVGTRLNCWQGLGLASGEARVLAAI